MQTKTFLSIFSLLCLSLAPISGHALNPNTASVDELADELDGIGPKLAQKIVQFREENGKFEVIEDLMLVKGIGDSVIDKNKDVIEFEE